jgi:UDP-N-acetylmuramate--alanine ligase
MSAAVISSPRTRGREKKALMKLPKEIGPIHFVGIGGIGMSGIAEVMLNLGHTVQGSDASDSANVKRLRERGAKVFVGHDAANLAGAAVVVVSSAIKRDNPELVAARARRIPVVRRAEMLAELMRLKQCVAIAGTHGKTTTTSLVATLLDAAGLDPTVINGGIINAYGTNARLGAGDWMVVEADESDGTFLKLPADIVIVTNIDPEHLDHFKTFEAIKEAFLALIENLPFYGFAVMCHDHPTVQELVGRIEDRRVLTYGENPQADIRLMDVDQTGGLTRFSVLIRERTMGQATYIDELALPMPGRHNALNATAAIAVAHELGAPVGVIRKAIGGFGGVKRRFTRTGEWNGVAVYDDYGHHPVEIAAVLKAARAASSGKVIAVVQPHRFTRLASLFDAFATCFNDADSVIVADVYPAGEAPIEGVDKSALATAIAAHGHRHAQVLPSPQKLAPLVSSQAGPGDCVVFLGAGSITQWAYALPDELAALDAARGAGR